MYKIFYNTWRKLSRVLPEGSSKRNVLLLSGGTTLGQIITILCAPILSRIFSPEDFGVFASFSSLALILTSFTALKYHCAIPLPRSLHRISSLIRLSFSLQILLTLFFSIIIVFTGKKLSQILIIQDLSPYIILLPLSFLLIGSYQILNYVLLKERAYKKISMTKIAQAICFQLSSIVLGLLSFRPLGLILGFIMGQSLGITYMAKNSHLLNKAFLSFKKASAWKSPEILSTSRRYQRFPLFSLWGGVINVASLRITPLLLAGLYGTQVAGWFAFGSRILQMPMIFVGQSIGQVFLQKGSDLNKKGKLKDFVKQVFRLLLMVGIFPILWIGVLSPRLFPWLFGPEWETAGLYVLFFSPWFVSNFICAPISSITFILEKQDLGLLINLALFVSRIVTLFFCSKFFDHTVSMIIFGLVSFTLYTCFVIAFLRMVELGFKEILSSIVDEAWKALFLVLPLLFLGDIRNLYFILASTASLIVYLVYIALSFRNVFSLKEVS